MLREKKLAILGAGKIGEALIRGLLDAAAIDVADVTVAELNTGATLAWASFPCQDLSLAGWHRGPSAERSGTFWAFSRIICAP